jgi:hypothetical protein
MPSSAQFAPRYSMVVNVVLVLGENVARTPKAPSKVASAMTGTVPIVVVPSVHVAVLLTQPVNIRLVALPEAAEVICGATPFKFSPVHSISTPAAESFAFSSTLAVVASAAEPESSFPLTIHPAVAADADAEASALKAKTATNADMISFVLDIR